MQKIHCQYSKLISVKELKPHPKNRNKHSKEQIERLAKILEYQGWRYPIKVSNQTGFITSGHGRLMAAQKLSLKEVPVSYQDYESEEQEYADVQSDNAIASWAELDLSGINLDLQELGPDFDLDLLGIKDFTLDVSEKGQCDEDEVPEQVEPKTKLGDLYRLGNHRLLCGDSTNASMVSTLVGSERIDMVFTDPPYGISVVNGSGISGSKPFGSVGAANGTCKRIIKAGVYKQIENDDTTETAVDAVNLLLSMKLKVYCFWGANHYASALPDSQKWVVWNKNTTGNFADCELAWTNLEGRVQKFDHTWNGLIKASERQEKRCHPTQKPIALAEWCFKELDPEGKNVIDLFGGSGSTLIASEKTNRKCFMMELDPHYCDVIVARWEKYTGQKAQLMRSEP